MNLVERLRNKCKDLGERYHRSPDEVEPDLWKAADEIDRLRAALEEIVEGKGRYSMDKLEHASNTIEDMKEIATNVLHKKSK